MKDFESLDSGGARRLVILREFDAPQGLVWKAWTEPARFAKWFGTPPIAAPESTISMDVRPGGQWQATMISETDGAEHPFVGTYIEVNEPVRLAFTLDNPQDRQDPNVEMVTVLLAGRDGGTEMVFRQEGYLPEEEYSTGLRRGWSGFFDRLAEHLAEAK